MSLDLPGALRSSRFEISLLMAFLEAATAVSSDRDFLQDGPMLQPPLLFSVIETGRS